MRKITAISTSVDSNGEEYTVALCDDGSVWGICSAWIWKRLPDIPQYDASHDIPEFDPTPRICGEDVSAVSAIGAAVSAISAEDDALVSRIDSTSERPGAVKIIDDSTSSKQPITGRLREWMVRNGMA